MWGRNTEQQFKSKEQFEIKCHFLNSCKTSIDIFQVPGKPKAATSEPGSGSSLFSLSLMLAPVEFWGLFYD